MKSLCIKTNNSNLLDYLLNELYATDLKNICFSINHFKHYKNIIIHYSGNDHTLFFSKISTILSLLVIDELEETILNRILHQNYFYFDVTEKNKILNVCFDIISEDFTNTFDKKFNLLYSNFLDYISCHKTLVLNGFINFRLKEYTSFLDTIVSEAVNSFIIEKEYLEFISLLKLFINSQPSNCEIVHIIYSPSESILLDEDKNVIQSSSAIFKTKYLSDISFSANDYTLNSLLSLLPKKVYVHLIQNYVDEFINTLQLIFENRVTLCTECDLCRLYHIGSKDSLSISKKDIGI